MADPVQRYSAAVRAMESAAAGLLAPTAFEALLPHLEALRLAAPTSAEVEASTAQWSSSWWQPVDAGDPLVP